MNDLDQSLLKSTDGTQLYVRAWDISAPQAVVVLVHGLGEHISRYAHVAAFLNNKGFAVFGFDHRGHGKSQGKRGHTPSLEVMYDDINIVFSKVKTIYPDKPVFLYGHSMGGNLVLNYVLNRGPKLTGVIVTGSFIRLAFQPSPVVVALGKAMRSIFPGFTQSNQLDPNNISSDPAEVIAYKNDPLVHDRLTASLGTRLLDSAGYLDHYKGEFPYPLLVMHGADDKITSPKGSENFAANVTGEITHLEWPGLYHEIHNEKQQNEVFQFTTDWIIKHIA